MASDGGIYTCQATLTVADDVFTFDDYSQVTLIGEHAEYCLVLLYDYSILRLLLFLWVNNIYSR